MKKEKVKNALANVFGCDARALATYRIALGLLILVDLALRLTDLKAFYTDAGVLPRTALLQKFIDPHFISIHLINGGMVVQATLFLIATLAAIALILGYKTRIATILSWFFLISLHSRNGMVLQGGDILFRLMLFWAMFLPLGKVWSLDAKKEKQTQDQIINIGTVGHLYQIIILYVFCAILKSGAEWHNGSAIYYALSIDQFVTPLGSFIYQFPTFLKITTYAVWYFQIIGPMLLLVPFCFTTVRTGAVAGFVLMQLGFSASLAIGTFPFFCIAAMIPLIPGRIFDLCSKNKEIQTEKKEKQTRRDILLTIFGILAMLYILLWNLSTIGAIHLSNKAEIPGLVLRLDQKWNMFSPYPMKDDGWFVIPGQLTNGKEIDVLTTKPVTFEKPRSVMRTYKNHFWRKYMMNLWLRENADYRLYYGQYLCREWNENHAPQEQLQTFEIDYMREDTLPDYTTAPIKKISLWRHDCFAHE